MNGRQLTTDDFITRAKEIHGDTYDYSETIYIKRCEYVDVICPKHGKFKIIAGRHINPEHSFGCSLCYYEARNQLKGIAQFIKEAKEKHKNRYGENYDYSNSVYTGAHKPITIVCKVHGEFTLTKARSHINQAAGCKKCSGNEHRTTKTFIEQAKNLHGGLYSYDPALYTRGHKRK